eukprot:jgi/Ulvmu1/5516/UM023_0052.1
MTADVCCRCNTSEMALRSGFARSGQCKNGLVHQSLIINAIAFITMFQLASSAAEHVTPSVSKQSSLPSIRHSHVEDPFGGSLMPVAGDAQVRELGAGGIRGFITDITKGHQSGRDVSMETRLLTQENVAAVGLCTPECKASAARVSATCIDSQCVCRLPGYAYLTSAAAGAAAAGCYSILPAAQATAWAAAPAAAPQLADAPAVVERGYIKASLLITGASLADVDTAFKRAITAAVRRIVAAVSGAADSASVPLGCTYSHAPADGNVYLTLVAVLPPQPQWAAALPQIAEALDEGLQAEIAGDAVLSRAGQVEVHGVQLATEHVMLAAVHAAVADGAEQQDGPAITADVAFVLVATPGSRPQALNFSRLDADKVDVVAVRGAAVQPLQVTVHALGPAVIRLTATPAAAWLQEQQHSCGV